MIIHEMHLVCDTCRKGEISGDADYGRAGFRAQARLDGWQRKKKDDKLVDICPACVKTNRQKGN